MATSATLSAQAGASIALTAGGAVNTGTLSVNGAQDISVNAGGNITLRSAVTSGAISLTTTSGNVVSQSGTTLTASSLSVNSKTGISLFTNTNTLTSLVNAISGDIIVSQPSTNKNLSITAVSNTGGGAVQITNTQRLLQLSCDHRQRTVLNSGGSLQLTTSGDISVQASLGGFSQIMLNADSNQSGQGALLVGTSATNIQTTNGPITVTAADIDLPGTINSGNNRTTIRTSVNNRDISLGGSTGLQLSNAELNKITAGVVQIGDTAYPQTPGSGTSISTGAISIDAPINYLAASSPLVLVTASTVDDGVAGTLTANNLRIAAGSTVTLDNDNDLGNVAAVSNGTFTLKDKDDIVFGSVDNVSGINSTNGNITLIQDDANVAQSINAGTGQITLRTYTASRDIVLGTGAGLQFDDGELDKLAASLIRVGDSSHTGNIVLNGEVSPSGTTKLSLVTTGAVTDSTPTDDIVVTDLAIQAGKGISADVRVTNLSAKNSNSGIIDLAANGSVVIPAAGLDGVTGVKNTGSGNANVAVIATGSVTVDAEVSAVNSGAVTLTAGSAANLTVNASVSSSSGAVSLGAGNNVTFSSAGDVTSTSGNVSVVATNGVITQDADSLINAGSGQISLLANGTVTLGGLTTTNNTTSAVRVESSNGSIVDGGDSTTNIVSNGTLTLIASKGIGDGNAIETSANVVAFTNNASGNVAIVETDNITVSGNNLAEGGTVSIRVTGADKILTVGSGGIAQPMVMSR